MNDTGEQERVERVESPAAKDPAVRLFIIAGMLLGFTAWCLSDLRDPPQSWDMAHVNEAGAYLLNNWAPLLFAPGGLVALIWGIVFLRRKLQADTEGIGYAGRQKIRWDDIRSVDASRLQSKGFLHLHYGDGQTLTLDSWKLRNFREMVTFVESHVPGERLTTGQEG